MDPYRVLGVGRDATQDEIRAAYRRLARELHPDVGHSETADMARLNDAWQTLRDPSRRATHDAAGDATPQMPRAAAHGGAGASGNPGRLLPRRAYLLVLTGLLLTLVVMMAILLVGFGRVGVAPKP